jgi:hypothetical protein
MPMKVERRVSASSIRPAANVTNITQWCLQEPAPNVVLPAAPRSEPTLRQDRAQIEHANFG